MRLGRRHRELIVIFLPLRKLCLRADRRIELMKPKRHLWREKIGVHSVRRLKPLAGDPFVFDQLQREEWHRADGDQRQRPRDDVPSHAAKLEQHRHANRQAIAERIDRPRDRRPAHERANHRRPT